MLEGISLQPEVLDDVRKLFNNRTDNYINKLSSTELALAFILKNFADIPKTRIYVENSYVDVPNIFCDIFKSNINGDLYDDEVANYAEVEYETDFSLIRTDPDITGLVVGESIVDEFSVKRYGVLSNDIGVNNE